VTEECMDCGCTLLTGKTKEERKREKKGALENFGNCESAYGIALELNFRKNILERRSGEGGDS